MFLIASVLGIIVASMSSGATGASGASGSIPAVTKISLTMAHAYQPRAAAGTTDDYHCTLVNPHVTRNSYIISSQFIPGSAEDHHAALFLVPPSSAHRPERDNAGGRGGRASGGRFPGRPAGLSADPLLSSGPRARADDLPKGTGIALPAGSLVIMQVHYNLLVGDKPVKNSLMLHTVPASTPLLPLGSQPDARSPGHPLPDWRDRTAVQPGRVARRPWSAFRPERRQRSERHRSGFVGRIRPTRLRGTRRRARRVRQEWLYRQGAMPTCTCSGAASRWSSTPGHPKAKTVLNVPNYNFDYQKVLQPENAHSCHRRGTRNGDLHL